jgi:ATP-dependent 26S proteasome regulatory subunit
LNCRIRNEDASYEDHEIHPQNESESEVALKSVPRLKTFNGAQLKAVCVEAGMLAVKGGVEDHE